MKTVFSAALALVILGAGLAHGHFIWLGETPSGEKAKAGIYFAELPAPDAPHLADKILRCTVWKRSVDGEPVVLTPKKIEQDGQGWLEVEIGEQPTSVELMCEYGVHRGMKLYYYAKHLRAKTDGQIKSLARADLLPLDIVPSLTADTVKLKVLLKGEPMADTAVSVLTPELNDLEVKTNDQGVATVELAEAGQYSFRVGYVDATQGGHEKGEKYKETRHYTTLTLTLGSKKAEKTKSVGADGRTATELLADARASRTVWVDFPGFLADMSVEMDGVSVQGKVAVSAAGQVDIKLDNEDAKKWARGTLRSIVSHRTPTGELSNTATFAEEGSHPLGRAIALDEDSMGSHYRIRNNVVSEVNRTMDERRFTISVLDVQRNAEGKYLPTVFTVNTWNKDDKLVSSQTQLHAFTRVGKFDLPQKVEVVQAGDDKYSVRRLKLSNIELLAAEE